MAKKYYKIVRKKKINNTFLFSFFSIFIKIWFICVGIELRDYETEHRVGKERPERQLILGRQLDGTRIQSVQ